MLRRLFTKLHKNSSGFSIVEMIVAFAILGTAAAAVGGFLITGVNSYGSGNAEASVQTDAQLALNQMQQTIIDAALGVSYNYRVGSENHFVLSEADSEVSGLEATQKAVYVFNWDSTRSNVEALIIRWDKESKEICYASATPTSTTGEIAESIDIGSETLQWDLLCENVSEFSCDLTDYEESKKVYLSLKVENKRRSYGTTETITLRNDVLINAENMSQIYERKSVSIPTTLTGITLTLSSNSIVRGGAIQMSTRVAGTGYPSQSIHEWKVEKVSNYGTLVKNEDGTIGVSDSSAAETVILYDSLSTTSGPASVELSTKVLSLASDASEEITMLKVTAVAKNAGIAVSDSKYVAVKSISVFSIQPTPDESLESNATLPKPESTYSVVSTEDTDTTIKTMEACPGNMIQMTSVLEGNNITSDDNKVVWDVEEKSENALISISETGLVAVHQYSETGYAIISASPSLNLNIKLYYRIDIRQPDGVTGNVLTITGGKQLDRGESVQLGLNLNGVPVEDLDDFDWKVTVSNTSGTTVEGTQATITDGELSVSRSLSYDYAYNLTVTATLRSNPNIADTVILTVPKVTLSMSPASYITTRGTEIEEGEINCYINGIVDGELTWSLASATNPSYYATALTNGSYITTGEDSKTAYINISSKEPSTLSYMRAKATLNGHTGIYATCYIYLQDVDIAFKAAPSSMNRGESTTLSAYFTRGTKSGIDLEDTSWSIVGVEDESGTATTTEGISLSAAKGQSVQLSVDNDYYYSSSSLTITVRANCSSFTQDVSVSINSVDTTVLTLNGPDTVNRGETISISCPYSGTLNWTISDSRSASLTLADTTNTSTKNLTVPVNYDTDNRSDDYIYVKVTVDGTGMSATKKIKVNQVNCTVALGGMSVTGYNPVATVTGFSKSGDYNVNWGLVSSATASGTAKSLNGVTLSKVNTLSTGSTATLDVTNQTDSIYMYVSVTTQNGTATATWFEGWYQVDQLMLADYSTLEDTTFTSIDSNIYVKLNNKFADNLFYYYRLGIKAADVEGVTYYYADTYYKRYAVTSYRSITNSKSYYAYVNNKWYVITSADKTARLVKSTDTLKSLFNADYDGATPEKVLNMFVKANSGDNQFINQYID